MNELYELVKNCEKCPNLMHCRLHNMEPAIMNHPNARILFVAQNPGIPLPNERGKSYEEVLINSRQGKLFVSKFLELSKLKYEDILWSNIVKCASEENREITKEEMYNCYPILQRQIDLLPNLEYIILLGKITQEYIKRHPLKTNAKIIDFVHPSYIMRTGQYELINDLVLKMNLKNNVIKSNNNKHDTILMQTKFNDIYRFYRDENGIKKCAKTEFNNYFYVLEEEKEKILELIKENNLDEDLKVDNKLYKSIYGQSVIKIIPNKFMFWKIKRLLKTNKKKTYEFDVDVYLKYLTLFNHKFSNNRRLGIIDIETDMSRDALNAPAPITAITLYNYENDNYYVWVLRNEKKQIPEKRIKSNEILFFFNNEKKMMEDFVEKFKNFDYDIVGGWYSNDFDFPYILNRLKNLKIDINQLSNFGEVSIRPWEMNKKLYFDIVIYGIELVDFIPVLQKNTCYQAQPASWSLESVSKFYLQKEKLVEIGPESWNTNINDFIAYNIRDVELVKELIDKFKLMEFLLVIQNEIVEVPLKHTTHNSIVLLYYLKKNYSDIIIPDNNGEIIIDGENININEHYIKIKAAHVIEANSGIYNNVSLFDFAGLYPTIFRTFNISPDTLNDTDGVEIDDIVIWKLLTVASNSAIEKEFIIKKHFRQDEEGIYPKLLKIFMDKKDFHKKRKKEFIKLYGEDDIRVTLETFRSDVFKQIANSLYGVGAFNRFNIFRPEVSAAVTSMSRKLIMFIEKYANNKPGFKALYGDSVTGDTTLSIRYKNRTMLIKISDLLDIISNQKTDRTDKNEYLFTDSVYVLSYNFKKKRTEYKKIEKLISHKTDKNKFNITSKNYCFNVTNDHGFYDINNNLISVNKYPNRIKQISLGAPPKQVNIDIAFTNKISEIDLLEISKKCIEHYTNNSLKKRKLRIDKKYFYLDSIDKFGKIYNTYRFPLKIQLNSDFGYILGAYIAEGSVNRNGWSGFRIAANDTVYIKKVYEKLIKIFGKEIIHLTDNDTRIVGGNYILSNLFKELGGYKSIGKKMPNFILETNKNFFLSILDGYMPGDGFHEHRSDNKLDYLKLAGVGSKSKLLISQVYFIMKNVFKIDNKFIRIRYRQDKNFYSCDWDLNKTRISTKRLQTKNFINKYYNTVYDVEVKDNHNFIDILGGVILHNTDSVLIQHPENLNIKDFEKELNETVKNFVFENFNINKAHYCLNFEHAKTFKKFVMKNAKKKYYGILDDGKFYVKGFDIVQHSISNKIKSILQEIYLKLVNGCSTEDMRVFLNEAKKRFVQFKPEDLGIEWRIANDLEEYDTNVQHIRAARYSNSYLKTAFKGGSTGKLLFIKETGKYPNTNVLFLASDSKLPKDFKIDYDKMWEKLILDKIRLLEDIKEMNVNSILNPNKTLEEFFK